MLICQLQCRCRHDHVTRLFICPVLQLWHAAGCLQEQVQRCCNPRVVCGMLNCRQQSMGTGLSCSMPRLQCL